MSTITLMRIYLRYHNMPRLPLPCIGYAGTLYSSPLIDRQRSLLIGECGRTNNSAEMTGASGILVKKGAMGSYHYRRSYSTSTTDIKKAEKERENPSKFKKRSAETVKIMVVSETGALSAMTLEEAGKLAKKKNLNLVHITNPKEKPVSGHGKEIYKLVGRLAAVGEAEEMEGSGEEETGGKKQKEKEVKTVLLKSNTGDHDIQSKVNSMRKWIQKGHRIRVVISQSGDKGSSENVFKVIEQGMKEVEGQVQQKIVKGSELRFYVGPPKKIKSAVKTPAHQSQPNHPNSKKGENSDLSEDLDDDEDDDTTVKRKAATRK